jgi:hypothetical protein
MEIEEQEFHFPAAVPLRAWRLFRVRPDPRGYVLYSPMFDDPDPTPWPTFKVAACNEDHPAPTEGCRCGIYAAVPGTLDSLPGYLLDTAHDPNPWAFAEVGCSGRVFVDMRGVRAERVEILRLHLAETCWPDHSTLAQVRQLLSARYGVAVSGMDGVPGWVLSNERDQGPPPDEVNLDLDLAQLDLPRPGRSLIATLARRD